MRKKPPIAYEVRIITGDIEAGRYAVSGFGEQSSRQAQLESAADQLIPRNTGMRARLMRHDEIQALPATDDVQESTTNLLARQEWAGNLAVQRLHIPVEVQHG